MNDNEQKQKISVSKRSVYLFIFIQIGIPVVFSLCYRFFSSLSLKEFVWFGLGSLFFNISSQVAFMIIIGLKDKKEVKYVPLAILVSVLLSLPWMFQYIFMCVLFMGFRMPFVP